jgi:hypothetical protein
MSIQISLKLFNLGLRLHYWKNSMSYMKNNSNSEQKSSQFLLAIKIPVSSAKGDHVYIVKEKRSYK